MIFRALARADELDLMSALKKSADHSAYRHRHAVHFRRISLGDDRNAQRVASPWNLFEYDVTVFHCVASWQRSVTAL
jgi:hypothetical protein